jgi:putative heme iron utilization protein
LAFTDPATCAPFISRIGFGLAPDGGALSLMSDLALHTAALRADPRAALLIGEPGPKGDPLNSARLSLQVSAHFVPANAAERPALRQAWLATHPKAVVYIDFADFSFVRFTILGGALNGGFARAYLLTPEDLCPIS